MDTDEHVIKTGTYLLVSIEFRASFYLSLSDNYF